MDKSQHELQNAKILSNDRDLRRDLHIYVKYIRERDVKRRHRTNDISKADSKRLAKLMGDFLTQEEVKKSTYSPWLDFIDWLALKLGFVYYSTEGTYMGYTSTEPSFPDNYIKFNQGKYKQFLELSLLKKEEHILKTLIDAYKYSNNEFFDNMVSPLSILDGFSSTGCATAVLPSIKFNNARGYLLNLLKNYKSDVWYTTASFIQYLKKEHPFFLIPERPNVKDRWWDKSRYGNFCDGPESNYYSRDNKIPDDASDAFERVEGRFVERFLEGIPLTMRYFDVAYDLDSEQKIYPSINKIKGFKINERFLRVMNKEICTPKATVQPNFEIHINSDLYPINMVLKLEPFADIISEDVSLILKLKKRKIAEQLAKHEDLDVISMLKELSSRDLPQNVITEIKEWSVHSEAFTLYDGFGLLECDEKYNFSDEFTIKNVSSNLKIIHSPDKLFSKLEKKELVPFMLRHQTYSLKQPPNGAKSIFVKKQKKVKKTKKSVNLKRRSLITLYFPSKSFTKMISEELKEEKCPFEIDELTKSITISENQQHQLDKIFENLKDEYKIDITDIK